MSIETILLTEWGVKFENLQLCLAGECSWTEYPEPPESLYFFDRNNNNVLVFIKYDRTIDAYEIDERTIITRIVGESPSIFVVTIYDFSYFKKLVLRLWECHKVVVDNDYSKIYLDVKQFEKIDSLDELYR